MNFLWVLIKVSPQFGDHFFRIEWWVLNNNQVVGLWLLLTSLMWLSDWIVLNETADVVIGVFLDSKLLLLLANVKVRVSEWSLPVFFK